jgi:hypothetical protein
MENDKEILNNILTGFQKKILKYQPKEKGSLERYLKHWRDSLL